MKRILSAAAMIAAAALAACGKKTETESAAPADNAAAADATNDAAAAEAGIEAAMKAAEELATADPDAPPADGTERFYGREKFTIVSTQTGAQAGEIIEHVRDWGRKRAEITRTTIEFGGYSQAVNTRMIQDGSSIANVNLDTGAVTTIENPMYNTIVARMQGRSGMEFGKEIMTQMGGRETGEKGSFAGHDCEYWELAAMGAKTCVAPWGGTLHTSVNMGGMAFERTASEVRMGDGGPDEAFAYDASRATVMPNVSDIMKKAQEAAQQQAEEGEPN